MAEEKKVLKVRVNGTRIELDVIKHECTEFYNIVGTRALVHKNAVSIIEEESATLDSATLDAGERIFNFKAPNCELNADAFKHIFKTEKEKREVITHFADALRETVRAINKIASERPKITRPRLCILVTEENVKRLAKWSTCPLVVGRYVYSSVYTSENPVYRYKITESVEDFFKAVGYEEVREPLFVYEGTNIYPETEAYFISLALLKIRKANVLTGHGESWGKDGCRSTKVYLSKESVNARLRELVEKKAKQKIFSYSELCDCVHYERSPLSFAIDLVEKTFEVKYL